MSTCISVHGEYSLHSTTYDDPLTCGLCGAFDEDAARRAVAERDEYREVIERVRGELRGPHPMPRDRRSQDHYPNLIERLLALLPDTPTTDERSTT